MNRTSRVRIVDQGDDGLEIRIDSGDGAGVTADHFAPTGYDAKPLPGDYVATASEQGSGREQALGYHDPEAQAVAQDGEVRLYARSPSTKQSICSLRLRNDGTIELLNDGGHGITISSDGIVRISGSQIVLDSEQVKAGSGASRTLALVGDVIAGTLDVSSGSVAGSIIGPGSVAGQG